MGERVGGEVLPNPNVLPSPSLSHALSCAPVPIAPSLTPLGEQGRGKGKREGKREGRGKGRGKGRGCGCRARIHAQEGGGALHDRCGLAKPGEARHHGDPGHVSPMQVGHVSIHVSRNVEGDFTPLPPPVRPPPFTSFYGAPFPL